MVAPPHHRKTHELGFEQPREIVDGAARLVAPAFEAERTGEIVWGEFFEEPTAW